MTPQELVQALQTAHGEQGRHLLQVHVPHLSTKALEYLIYYIKREADRSWADDVQQSFLFSGYLLFIADLTQNKYCHALGLMARGDSLRRMDREQEAIPFLDAAGEEFLAMNDEVSWARTRIGRVSACLRLGRTTEALRDAEAAHDIFIRHGKLYRAGQVDVNAAVVNYELGRYDQALRLFDRAIETYQRDSRSSKDKEDIEQTIARAKANKAITLAALGRFREALALHEQARATFAKGGAKHEIAVARQDLNIADTYAAQGHYSQALRLFMQSRALFLKYKMDNHANVVAQQMCLCLIRLNRTREAYELAGETVQYFRSSSNLPHDLARSLMYQAIAATLEGDFREAEALLQEAGDLFEEGGGRPMASLVRLQRAELYFADGQLEASLNEAQYAADVFAELEDLPQLARAMFLQARIADKMGDSQTAEHLCLHALDIAQSQELLDLTYNCEDLLGQLAEQRGELVAAARYYDRAVQGIDEVQSRLVLDERTNFLENKGGIYQRAILLALKRGEMQQALIYVEKAKSRVLGDYLRNNIDIRLRAGDKAGEAILEDLSRLREDQAWFSSIVRNTGSMAALSDTAMMRAQAIGPVQARKEMQKREQQIERLLEQMQLRSAGDLVSRQRAHWTNSIVTSLLPRLESTILMVEYYLAGLDLYIFQMTRQGVQVHTVVGAVPKLERLLSLWRANLDLASQTAGLADRFQAFSGLQENCLGLLQRLYELLLGPIAPSLQAYNHLIIVPYGTLHYVPFHCLFDGVQFLIERLNLSYLPATSLLDICRQRAQRVASQNIPPSEALVLGLSDGGKLAFAVQEASVVAQQLGTTPILDKAATTACLEEAGKSSPIVHIAAHGMFRLDSPNFSYIKLADRTLNAIEVFNLDLAVCSLVTLSACETGRGVVKGLDEVIGLGRGFLYAGAASLLPTLWRVDDASSAELMEMFYAALLKRHSKVSALASAQRAFIARARTSVHPYRVHPYFWGAFHLIGDYGPL
jgi:CHAT domain-containing protein